MLIMHLALHDIQASFTVDDDGNYTDLAKINLPHPKPDTGWYTMYVKILPPEDQ